MKKIIKKILLPLAMIILISNGGNAANANPRCEEFNPIVLSTCNIYPTLDKILSLMDCEYSSSEVHCSVVFTYKYFSRLYYPSTNNEITRQVYQKEGFSAIAFNIERVKEIFKKKYEELNIYTCSKK